MRNNQSTVYQWIAGILALLLLVILAAWLFSEDDFEEVTSDFNADLIAYRQQIDAKCTYTATTTAAQKQDCDETLDELTVILNNYRIDLKENEASTTPSTDLPVTTPTSTATSS